MTRLTILNSFSLSGKDVRPVGVFVSLGIGRPCINPNNPVVVYTETKTEQANCFKPHVMAEGAS